MKSAACTARRRHTTACRCAGRGAGRRLSWHADPSHRTTSSGGQASGCGGTSGTSSAVTRRTDSVSLYPGHARESPSGRPPGAADAVTADAPVRQGRKAGRQNLRMGISSYERRGNGRQAQGTCGPPAVHEPAGTDCRAATVPGGRKVRGSGLPRAITADRPFPPRSAARWQGADSPLVASVAVSVVRYVEHRDDLLISAPAGRKGPQGTEHSGLDL